MATDLHIVTGKGGTGKTTVAAALALRLAGAGRRVLLCEVEGRQGIAQVFDVAPLPYAERKIAVGKGGGEVFAIAIEPEAALLEYLQMFYKLGRAGKALDRFGVIDFATTIAPGVRDVLLTGKVYEAARRTRGSNFVYDAVVLDAPPTGRIGRFLNVNSEVAGLAKVGPIEKQAQSVMTMMRATSTKVHFTTFLEQMPVQETIDSVNELRSEGLPLGHVVVNQVRPDRFTPAQTKMLASGKLTQTNIEAALSKVDVSSKHAPMLLADGLDYLKRQQLQDAERENLHTAKLPILELPYLIDGVDLGGLFELAEQLTVIA